MRKSTQEIMDFILQNVLKHPKDIVRLTAAQFTISRQAAHRHLHAMVKQRLLECTGNTRNRTYAIAARRCSHTIAITPDLEEDREYRNHILPLLSDLPENVRRICDYGFTEILNNAKDHSAGSRITIEAVVGSGEVQFTILDNGVGIFRKISKECHLADPHEAILELAKGKLTTDAKHHTGEGIFFASRMFDTFSILSGDLIYVHRAGQEDWLVQQSERPVEGTSVRMTISQQSKRRVEEVFHEFAAPEEYDFTRTLVPVALAQYGQDELVSRSQAKRVLSRFVQFKEVILDFHNVRFIGQAFADEIFRVFSLAHPEVKLHWTRADAQVEAMIRRATAAMVRAKTS